MPPRHHIILLLSWGFFVGWICVRVWVFCNLIFLIGKFCGISHLFRNSTSSIVLGRETPLVSGSNSTKPPPINVMTPEWHNGKGKNHWQQKYIKTDLLPCSLREEKIKPFFRPLTRLVLFFLHTTFIHHQGDKHTKDDERQVLPDVTQSVQQERRQDASDITKNRAKRHSQVPACKNTQMDQVIEI